jgi:hypothetical protein
MVLHDIGAANGRSACVNLRHPDVESVVLCVLLMDAGMQNARLGVLFKTIFIVSSNVLFTPTCFACIAC